MPALPGACRAALLLVACQAIEPPARAQPAPAPLDTGLGQQLRQQLASTCYGFVEHDPTLVRGFEVDSTFQFQRDGYPWAQFEVGSNLLIEREEVLVGGAGAGCGRVPPGGAVNLVTRRTADLPTRTVLTLGQHGGASLLHEAAPLRSERVQGRLAVREERWREPGEGRLHWREVAAQLDWAVTAGGRLRLDVEWQRGDFPNGVAWPAIEALPAVADPDRRLEQDWTRYREHQSGVLLAWEQALGPSTDWRLGRSDVRLSGGWNDLYLNPTGPNDAAPFETSAYVFPARPHRFTAWHSGLRHGFDGAGARQRVELGLSRLSLSEPDESYPAQNLGLWRPGQTLPAPAAGLAEAGRRLRSQETRLSVAHSAQWTHWQTQLAAIGSRTRDDNGAETLAATRWSPLGSLAWLPDAHWRLQFTRSEGSTARQYASIGSDTPDAIAPPGRSVEHELGLRWTGERWSAGAGLFRLSRPYRFERETVSVWRGRQQHRGIEGTLNWTREDDAARVVLTAQSLRAEVTGTGDPSLEGRRPPGVPARRASLYAEAPWPGTPWTASLLGEAVSRRATFDDNRVFAAGYGRWDLGLQWNGRWLDRPLAALITLENLGDRRAWADVGGGLAYPLQGRRLGLTLTLGG